MATKWELLAHFQGATIASLDRPNDEMTRVK